MIEEKIKREIGTSPLLKNGILNNLNLLLKINPSKKIIITSSCSTNYMNQISRNIHKIQVKKDSDKHELKNNLLKAIKSFIMTLYHDLKKKNEYSFVYLYYILLFIISSSIKNVYCGGKNRIFSKINTEKIRFSHNIQRWFSNIHVSGVIGWF